MTTPAFRFFPPLPVDANPVVGAKKRVRICIVSNEFVGPSKNGGIGTAYTVLGEALAAAGHEVVCLYSLGEECASHDIKHWQKYYKQRRVDLVPLPTSVAPIDATPFAISSYEVYRWLKQHDRFDFIHFPECQALGYYTQLAQQQGLAFASATICVGLHSMHEWIKQANREYVAGQGELHLDHMEQQSVMMADVVWSPSQYLINWIAERGWQLPARCYVQPYIMPHAARQPVAGSVAGLRPVEEFVFFGRLETRKGLALFCDAIDRLPAEAAAKLKQITFLGREAMVDGVPAKIFIARRAKAWRSSVQILTDKNQPEAVAYMRGAGRLAIMPSLMENSPNTVYECLGAGLAFLASRAGGIPELVAPEDAERVCFAIRPDALAGKLAAAVGKSFRPAKIAFDANQNEQAWVRWHEQQAEPGIARPDPATWPKVSLCLTTCNRPRQLVQALASIEAVTYPNLEVILVDDGSTQPEVVACLEQLQPGFAQHGWQIVRQSESHPAAARNAAARQATGEFLLFMEDESCAEPQEVMTLVRALLNSGADIVTCGANYFTGQEAPDRKAAPKGRWLPLGGAASAGALVNCFGDANALVRRACFEALGGFTEDYGVTHEDWEFFANAVLRGYKLQAVPEFLFWYRVNTDSKLRTQAPYLAHARCIRPYIAAVPPALRKLMLYAQGSTMHTIAAGSGAEWAQYAQLTVQWRSKLEAGLALEIVGQPQVAAKLMLAGVKAVESCKHPKVVLEALLEICSHLGRLDAGRTRFLLGMAVTLAENLRRPEEKERAESLLAALSSPAKINQPSARVAVGV